MVLEIKVPVGVSFHALRPLLPVLLSYVLSFVYVGIYWNNHHHFLAVSERVSGAVLWANLHLLFWLSLVPLTTEWMGQHPLIPAPTVIYGVVLLAAAIAFGIMGRTLVAAPGQDSRLAAALGRDTKGKMSPFLYAVAILTAFFQPVIADVIYVCVALVWLVPDRRIERAVYQTPDPNNTKEQTDMAQFSLNQAMKAQAALREAAGEGEETFDERQLVGMLSDEIRTLRASGSDDEEISQILKTQANVDLDTETIKAFYVDTSGYERNA